MIFLSTILFFAVFYTLAGGICDVKSCFLNKSGFWNNLYFSSITISTVGYGDYLPSTSITKTLSLLEGLTGITLASLFGFSLSKRYGN